MRKCLLVTIDYPPQRGGVATYWERVTASMPIDQWEVLTSIRAKGETDVVGLVYRKPLLGILIWPRWLRGVWTTYAAYRSTRSELIVAAQVLPVGAMAYVLHKLFRIPYIVQVYGMDLALAKQHPRKARLAKRVLGAAKSVIANSEATAQLLTDFSVPKERVTIVYPVPSKPMHDTNRIEQLRLEHELQGKRVVLTVGRLVERKGQDKTLEALAILSQSIKDLVYVIVGDGPHRQYLEQQADTLGVKTLFLGEVSNADRDAWLHLCDVFVMPSRSLPGDMEGFGMVFLEAAACAKAVVAGNSGGVSEAVMDKQTGLLVDPNSVTEISDAMKRLLNDTMLTKQLGEQAQKRYQEYWSWNVMVERLKQRLV